MEFAADLARKAGAVVLRHYQQALSVERKADRTPVTAADRAAEELMREEIRASYPEDGVLGEEYGEIAGSSGMRWVLDPIDGTKSFIQGVPLFGMLIGLEGPEGSVAGAAYFPALDEMICAARGEGSWWNGRRAGVSRVDDLSEACITYTSLRNFDQAGAMAAWESLAAATRIQRGWGDCYGHLLVATGRAEAMFDPILNSWDCSPWPPILEEAGGTFTDWKGNRTIHGGSGFSTNGRLFRPVLDLLGGGAGASQKASTDKRKAE